MMLNRVDFVVYRVLPQSCLTATCPSASAVALNYFVLSASLGFVFVIGTYSSYQFGCPNECELFIFPSFHIQFLFRFKMSKGCLEQGWTSFFLLGAKISVLQHNFFSSDIIWNLFTSDYLTKFHVAYSQIILQRWGSEFISNFFSSKFARRTVLLFIFTRIGFLLVYQTFKIHRLHKLRHGTS